MGGDSPEGTGDLDRDLVPDALKDLTVSPDEGDDVAGGATTPGGGCYAGTW